MMTYVLPPIPEAWHQELAVMMPDGWSSRLSSRIARLGDDQVLPARSSWFRALEIPPSRVRVLILGQDPYHGPGQANGLAFSVNDGVAVPPSLRNIIKQARSEGFACRGASTGDLTPWHDQGVMLLNTCLTVSPSQPGSHHGWGWEALTDAVVTILSRSPDRRVFMLWGAPARAKKTLVGNQHLVLESAHPSPLSAYRGFLGNGHFTAANDFLRSAGGAPIEW